jgi:hypothetical protein
MTRPRGKARRNAGQTGSSRNRRLRLGAVGVLLVALVALFICWLRREPAWTVKITPESTTTSTFAPITLHGEVLPASVLVARNGWHWKWSSESARIEGDGSTAKFTGDHEGDHHVRVIVKSPWGTEKTAELDLLVKASPFLVGLGNANVAADDASPDVVRSDLPFRIVDVTVDKPEVCRGEQTVIRVRAEDDRGTADWLLPTIGGKTGWAVVMAPPGHAAGRYKIGVVVTDPEGGAPDDAQPPYQRAGAYITLKDCDAPAVLRVTLAKAGEAEEDLRLAAAYHGAPGEIPASYVWDFGDASAQTTTKEREARHLFPSEEERGPGKRVFTYLIHVDALDASGKVLASGVKDVWLRNRKEELKHTMHVLQLMAEFPPMPRKEENGDRVLDIKLKNIDMTETANITNLEYRLGPCDGKATAEIQQHSAGDVFPAGSVPPRGTLQGQLRWPAGSSDAVCFLDVAIHGTSSPGKLAVGGGFSMRTQIVSGVGAIPIGNPEQSRALAKMMKERGTNYLSPEDAARANLGKIPNQPTPPPLAPRHAPKPGQ